MKNKTYSSPEVEITKFTIDSVIATSGGGLDDNDNYLDF